MKRQLCILGLGLLALQTVAQVKEYKFSQLSIDPEQRQYWLESKDKQPLEGECCIIYPGYDGEKEECAFRNGKRHGSFLYFREYALREKGEYREGLEEGVFQYYDSDGKTLRREASYKAGKLDGIDKEYYSSGKLRSETWYVMGVKDGVDRNYDQETGKITLEQHYKDDELQGKSLSFVHSSDGNHAIERSVYEKGRQNGAYSLISLDGTVREAGYFKLGRRDGEWLSRDLGNKKTGIRRVYEEGMIVEQEEVDDFDHYIHEHWPELEGLKW